MSSGILNIDIGDHLPTFINLKTDDILASKKVKIQLREINDSNKIKFITMLHQMDWNAIKSHDPSIFAENFISKLNELYCAAFPRKVKYVSSKHYNKPWINNYSRELIAAKADYFLLFRLSLVTAAENNRFRNRVNNIIRDQKVKFHSDLLLKCKNDLKKTWKIINNILSRNLEKKSVKKIIFNNLSYSEDVEIASIFNDFFCSIGMKYDSEIPFSNLDPCHFIDVRHSHSFFLEPVSVVEVEYYIKTLKNSKQDINSISIQIFKENSSILSTVIVDLINVCFQAGIFPKILKKAIVLPLFKNGDPEIMSNYRPISILPTLSKIIEKCLKSRLLHYFGSHNLFNQVQFGYQNNISTQDAILHVTEKIYDNLHEKLSTLAVFIDFSKCFDTLNRNILLRKLEAYGIRGIPLQLFESYLSDRYQAVKVNDTVSSFKLVNTGVPQGSVLGPILYLIYVNELPYVSNLFSVCLFADDTTLIFESSNKSELLQKCNTGISVFYNWCCANRLSVNFSKTHTMLFSNILQPLDVSAIYMNGRIIDYASSVKFLGLIIDEKLKFNLHIDHISQKISKSAGMLYKLKQYVPIKTLTSIYRSFVDSYLNYCTVVFGKAFQVHIIKLEVAQRKCVRIVAGLPPLSHSNSIFYDLKLLKFKDIYNYNLGVYMYKNIGKFDSYIRQSPYDTRSNDQYNPTTHRLTLTQNQSIKYQALILWNDISSDIRLCPSLSSFKYNYRSSLISKYSLLVL